jgi:hypothetical protein
VKAATYEVEELENREQTLAEKETLLASRLSEAEAELADLNRRLDEIDREFSQPGAREDEKPAKRP